MVKMGFEHATEQEQTRLGELLWDIHAAGMKILEFTSGRDFAEFQESELLQSVVTSMLGIIAGSLNSLKTQFPAEFAKISNGEKLAGAETLSPEELWRVVEEQVPELVAEARAILEDWHQG